MAKMSGDQDGGPIRQRKQMAMGQAIEGQGDDFGVPGLPAAMPHPDKGMDTGKVIGDGSRGSPPPFGGGKTTMANTHAPDHGPHSYRKGG